MAAKLSGVYGALEGALLAEVEESENNSMIDDLINQSLKNTSEPTDFDVWADSTARTVEQSLAAIDEWSLMKQDE